MTTEPPDPEVTAHGEKLASEFALRYPGLAAHTPRKRDFTIVTLGTNELGVPVRLEETPRLEHMHVIGSTGSGKTTFLKNLILQDFFRGRGGVVIDPHGGHHDSLYHQLLAELDAHGYAKSGRVHVIDPNIKSHIIPFNPLARFEDTDVSVISDALLQAFERAWGDEDTHQKPTIRKILKATFMALAELGHPLIDAKQLYDPHDRAGFRASVISRLDNEYARDTLEELHQTALDERSKRDFRAEVVGPINRINEFVSSDAIRAMLGIVDAPHKPRRTLDLLSIMNRGDILLVNLQHGAAVSEADTNLLGAILLRYIFLLCSRRRNLEPFFLYVDECHRYLTGDVPNILAETRKYGIGAVLSHQFEAQLGKRDDLIYQALLNSTEIKVVFRVKSPEEAQRLAEMVIPLDLERPVEALIKPTVVDHEIIQLTSASQAKHQARSTTKAESESITDSDTIAFGTMQSSSISSAIGDMSGQGIGQVFTPDQGWIALPTLLSQSASVSTAVSEMHGTANMSGTSEMRASSTARSRGTSTAVGEAEGDSISQGVHEALRPKLEDRPTAVHSKENMLYRAGQLIMNLPVGRAFIAWRGKSACVTIRPPQSKR